MRSKPGREPSRLNAVRIQRQMKSVLFGGGADRQDRGGARGRAPRHSSQLRRSMKLRSAPIGRAFI